MLIEALDTKIEYPKWSRRALVAACEPCRKSTNGMSP